MTQHQLAALRCTSTLACAPPVINLALTTACRCDELHYRILTLDNGLRAVVVSDPETDKAAASLDVRVGSMLDPPELQGLAHFLEHMLFYASEK